MIRKIFLSLAIIVLAAKLFAQSPIVHLTGRQVSGIVIDSTKKAITGAIVTLTSKTDTLKITTNEQGLFLFTNVKAWEFTLSVGGLGYRTFVKIGKYNDANPHLIMDPVVLKISNQLLKEVVIKGAPSIIYKTDTVEYQASDYVVREGASVGDLLNRMQGMHVDDDGNLTYNGMVVKTARLNGKDFINGNVGIVTKILPADIVEKVQIIDDYGPQAARTGIKEGPSSQVLNITTKANRSMGYIGSVGGNAGNNGRYEGSLLGSRINANRNYALAMNMSNTLNGLAGNAFGGGSPDGSGGTTKKNGVNLTYRDQWGKKIQVNLNYSFNAADAASANSSISQNFSTNGTTFSTNESDVNVNSKAHNLNFEFEDNIDSANYLRIVPTLSYTSSVNNNQSASLLSGLIHQNQKNTGLNSSRTPNYGLTALYQHYFRKKRRNFTIQLSGSNRAGDEERDQTANIIYFNQAANSILKDSLIHSLIERNNLVGNYKVNTTWSEPLSSVSALQFNSQVNYNGYDNTTITTDLNQLGSPALIDSLSNRFKYSVTETRLAFGYRYSKSKTDLTIGATGIPLVLSGTNLSTGTSLKRTSFNVIPLFRLNFNLASHQSMSLNYSGTVIAPRFDQIQPVRDVSNPQNITVGNAKLKPAFNHTINSQYSLSVPASRFRATVNLNTIFYKGRIISNILQTKDAYNSLKYETHYLNTDGTYRTGGNYTITKQSASYKYGYTLSGNLDHLHNIGMSNNSRDVSSQWTFMESFRMRVPSSEKFELNPGISYSYSSSENSLPTAIDSKMNILSFNANGKMVFMKSWVLHYSANKNFVYGINSSLTNNPFVMNASVEKEFLKRKTLRLHIQSFDLFNENKLLNRNITEISITDIRSNSLSRYFMLGLSVSLQSFKGIPAHNGVQMQRRGDGSFIY